MTIATLRHRRIKGVPVIGRTREFPAICDRVGARTAIVAIPGADSELLRDLHDLASVWGINLKVVPANRSWSALPGWPSPMSVTSTCPTCWDVVRSRRTSPLSPSA